MLSTLRSLVNRLGFDVVRTATFHNSIADHLRNVLAQQQIDAVLDFGAHRGTYGKLLRRIGFTGRIYSFEPVSGLFAHLQRAAAGDHRWFCLNAALSDAAGSQAINVYEGDVFSLFLEVNQYSKVIWENLNRVQSETVRLARLDELHDEMPHFQSRDRVMLKLDTQCCDLKAFREASGTLPRIHMLQSEITFIPLYGRMDDPYEVLSEYRDAGFFINGIYQINRDPSLTIVEYDWIMLARPETPRMWETAPAAG